MCANKIAIHASLSTQRDSACLMKFLLKGFSTLSQFQMTIP